MTTFPLLERPKTATLPGRVTVTRLFSVVAMLALSAGLLLLWDEIKALGVYGYPAVFVGALLSSATVLLPGPGLVLVAAAAVSLDPLPVALLAGSGAALGELTAYLAGAGGRTMVADRPFVHRLEKLMRRCGSLVLFVLALVPNPIIDVGGFIAGALEMPAWRFLLATWLGKSLRYGMLAALGALAL